MVLHFCVGVILTLVCIWDHTALKVTGWAWYYPFKIFSIAMYFGPAWLLYKNKMSHSLAFDISTTWIYIYSYIGTLYLHPTYLFSFYEALTILCLVYSGNPWRYIVNTLLGVTLASLAIHTIPEPDFVKEGFSLKPHLQIVTVIFGVLGIIVYFLFNRQREKLAELTNRFASIGQQAAFLLHELKSPLARFLSKHETNENKDAEYIYSIIEGVELLVTKKKGVEQFSFQWESIASYLREEFQETCSYYQITLTIEGLEGQGHGHRSTLKLALKNLVKNAIESIAASKSPGVITVVRKGEVIEVSNNGPLISQEKLSQMFTPFYSDKSTDRNFGIGLHFVESVVNAHKGEIKVLTDNSWNTFRITLGAQA